MKDLEELARLIRRRNDVEMEITRIVGRPAQIGHLGEYIAARVFRVTLAASAAEKGHDGRFEEGPLQGRTVNIKWYAKREGLLDLQLVAPPNFYLVLTGPHEPPSSSHGAPRPWLITSVFLFDALQLSNRLLKAGVKMGVATSVRRELWEAAEMWPTQRNATLLLTDNQRGVLALFS